MIGNFTTSSGSKIMTFEAATQNNNHKTLFKIFKSTSERVNFLKRRLANIQSIFQKLGPGEQKSIILEHFSGCTWEFFETSFSNYFVHLSEGKHHVFDCINLNK